MCKKTNPFAELKRRDQKTYKNERTTELQNMLWWLLTARV